MNNTVDLKNINLIKNSIENITICKQTYLNFYNQISQYFENITKNLPGDERNEIGRDLQRNDYFINLSEINEFSDHNIIDTFYEFFQQHGRFPGSQDFIVFPRLEISYFIKTDKIVSTNQLFEKLSSSDACGLFSIQALARQALTEFLHNMSHQTLSKDNNNIFIQFDRTTELIIELISMLLDRNNKCLSIANIINDNKINDKISDYRFPFDIPTEIKIQQDMEEILKNKKTLPTPHPPYVPPPLLTNKEIETERDKEDDDLIKTSLQMSKDELDAANESADKKIKRNYGHN